MGAKSSKLFRSAENSKKLCSEENIKSDSKDPRSPDVMRTPLNELNMNGKGQDYVFKDPRSPTSSIMRTPIVFDSDQSRSFVFEETDTFNELFPKNVNPEVKVAGKVIEECDPRSPTLQIDRTPLIFEDNENLELPPITLSDEEDESEDRLIQSVLDMMKFDDLDKPKNKPLERVKNMHKKQKSSTKSKENSPKIYQDTNVFYSTPKKESFLENSRGKRTPFGCVENKLRMRSKSVESIKYKSGKSLNVNFEDDYFKESNRICSFESGSGNNSFII
ncbi:uncharacterized protein LOC129616233 [Condylostylus longicornis]|uniref:uncharacterized protein LOC129616233 n=1 Tax=Condylostylus longicornis TaxID=2530218 RepID=UPI00244E06D8|nr:uncharacterized protein LOC129616233 [Condylostylus longicornis]